MGEDVRVKFASSAYDQTFGILLTERLSAVWESKNLGVRKRKKERNGQRQNTKAYCSGLLVSKVGRKAEITNIWDEAR